MLHGFMGSPVSSRPMADYLAQRDITVHCPLLPGHGELPDKLYGARYEDWIAEAQEGLATVRDWCDEIFIMGHSMGTVLGAYLAHANPDIRGLIMLAPLYKPPSRAIAFLRVLRYVIPWFYPWRIKRLQPLARERILDLYPDLNLDDPEVQAWLPQATRVPTGAIDEMRKVADIGRRLWPDLTMPALLLQGEQDIAVDPGNTEAIYEALGSKDKVLHTFPQAGHELMRPFDPVHEKVWPLVLTFIQERVTDRAQARLHGASLD
jgi:carboxylesterase